MFTAKANGVAAPYPCLLSQSGLSRQALAFAFGEQFVELLLVVVIAKVIV